MRAPLLVPPALLRGLCIGLPALLALWALIVGGYHVFDLAHRGELYAPHLSSDWP